MVMKTYLFFITVRSRLHDCTISELVIAYSILCNVYLFHPVCCLFYAFQDSLFITPHCLTVLIISSNTYTLI
uniref:Uncharacterized protein n=1 Tax=Anguilla anguilla TaxID=7936 RepID=A0A0E9T5V4_ANGAN